MCKPARSQATFCSQTKQESLRETPKEEFAGPEKTQLRPQTEQRRHDACAYVDLGQLTYVGGCSTRLLFLLMCDGFEGSVDDGEEGHEHDADVGHGHAGGCRLVLDSLIFDALGERFVHHSQNFVRRVRHRLPQRPTLPTLPHSRTQDGAVVLVVPLDQ